MGFWMSLHIHNNIRTNRNNFVSGVVSNISKGLTHQDGSVTLALFGWVGLGVNKMSFARHKAVVSVPDLLIVYPDLVSM
jgi:hypothetical protein